MMSKSAFPVFDSRNAGQDYECADPGMTLRDYFAAKAMQASLQTITNFPDENWRQYVAIDAYAMADAMMSARGE